MKDKANEIFGTLERYQKGQCSYDRALEDASNIINKEIEKQLFIKSTIPNFLNKNNVIDILENMDIVDIENFLRAKKIQKITKKKQYERTNVRKN